MVGVAFDIQIGIYERFWKCFFSKIIFYNIYYIKIFPDFVDSCLFTSWLKGVEWGNDGGQVFPWNLLEKSLNKKTFKNHKFKNYHVTSEIETTVKAS